MSAGQRRRSRVASAYRASAILLLNTLLLVAALTVFAAWLFPIRSYQEPVYSKHFKPEAYTRTSPEVVRETWRKFDTMGERSSFRFHPWAVFSERPYSRRYVGVTEAGQRRTSSPIPSSPTLRNVTVWTFGGSTLFGWGLPDSQTIASPLQGFLQRELEGSRVIVINHGHAYWFSSMELALMLARLRVAPNPSAIVFLDGLNDALRLTAGQDVPIFADVADLAWERERRRRYGATRDEPWVHFNESFPLQRLAQKLRRRIFGDPPARPSRFRRHPENPVAEALSAYRVNRAAIRAVGSSLGIPTHQFLQPTPFFGDDSPPGPTPESYKWLAGFYEALLREDFEGFHPIVDAVRGVKTPYIDRIHYGDEAAYRVAGRIAEVLLPELRRAASRPASKRGARQVANRFDPAWAQ